MLQVDWGQDPCFIYVIPLKDLSWAKLFLQAYVIVEAGKREHHKSLTSSESFCSEVTHVISAHIVLAKTSHITTPNSTYGREVQF